MSYGRNFWKHMREFDTKKETERSSDFKVEVYKNYEFQIWTNEKGRPALRVYRGVSGKPVSHYYYHNEVSRQETIDGFKKSVDTREKMMTDRKEARKNLVNPFKVGDILTSSWGYDQTNVDFYEVIEVTNKSVRIEKIGNKTIDDNGPGGLSVIPNTSYRSGNVMLKRVSSVSADGKSGWINLTSYSGANKWDGTPQYETHPAFGH